MNNRGEGMKITLSGEELLYLSAIVGVDNIWDINDPFADYGENRLITAMLDLQEALTRRGYLVPQVDGQFTVNDDCRQLLKHCMDSETVYILNSSQTEEDNLKFRFFVHDNLVVQYRFNGSANLSQTTVNLMRAEIEAFFGDAAETENGASLVTGVARLRRMGSLSRQRFLQELRSTGCEDELALLIADGLQGNADFCSVLMYRRQDGSEKLVDKLVTLRFAGGSLMVTPGETRIDTVCFTRLSHEKLKRQLDEMFGAKDMIEAI